MWWWTSLHFCKSGCLSYGKHLGNSLSVLETFGCTWAVIFLFLWKVELTLIIIYDLKQPLQRSVWPFPEQSIYVYKEKQSINRASLWKALFFVYMDIIFLLYMVLYWSWRKEKDTLYLTWFSGIMLALSVLVSWERQPYILRNYIWSNNVMVS